MSKFEQFARLHVAGEPLVLFNIWDAGSAVAVAMAGAKAIATGSASVAAANGFADGEAVPMDFAIANAKRIVDAVDLPVTVDFEGGYAADPEEAARNVAKLAATGAIGCNFEDQVVGTDQLYPIADQAARIAAVRRAVGPDFFINARTDIFLKAPIEKHDAAMVDAALERARAYADAGASGFFVPRLADPRQIERVVREVSLPLNVIAFPGAPDKKVWADAGVARISHGPFPHRALMATLTDMARTAIS